ncbi:MAG: GNAT family N-acetyltransferase [Vagococcus sp.]|uniref:GNAT family N-acetyltransferase n=1 Tax=Vagococcus sp. TaxID=1933889 RepID=UPI002FC95663
MIKKLTQDSPSDWEAVFSIWLETNKSAHSFIDESYWENALPMVKEIMPSASVYVYTDKDKVVGFIGLVDNMIEGIFISQNYQGKGIGKKLLSFAKNEFETLQLSVYKENHSAYGFYVKENFSVISESTDETGHVEYTMEWHK